MDESKMGEMRRVRRKMGSITVAIELVRNEGERAFIYTWRGQSYPSWMQDKCPHPSNSDHLKEGALLGFWRGEGDEG
jgi:hypothetical protein